MYTNILLSILFWFVELTFLFFSHILRTKVSGFLSSIIFSTKVGNTYTVVILYVHGVQNSVVSGHTKIKSHLLEINVQFITIFDKIKFIVNFL